MDSKPTAAPATEQPSMERPLGFTEIYELLVSMHPGANCPPILAEWCAKAILRTFPGRRIRNK